MLQWCDNFSNYGSGTAGVGNMLDGLPYASIAMNNSSQLALDPDGASAGRVFCIGSSSSNSNLNDSRMVLKTPNKTIGHGARFYRTSLPATAGSRPTIIAYRTVANARLYDLIVEPNGALGLYNASGTLVESTVVPVFTTNTWQHIELKINTETGDYELRREGVSVMSGTDPSPPNVLVGLIGWSSRQDFTSATGVGLYMKDLVVWDNLGSYNTDFMGTVSVVTCAITADESSSGFTPSTGTDLFAVLDEETPDDADYMTATAAPAEAVFTLEDLPVDITSVRAVQTMVRAMKNDGGDAKMQVSMKSVAAFDAGADHSITPSMTYWWDISEEDPNTTAQWTPGTFNDASLKIARTL